MFKLKKKNTPPSLAKSFHNIPPTFPPKFPNGLNGPKVFGCKNFQTSFGTSDTAENKCSPRRVQVNFDHESWSAGVDPAVDPCVIRGSWLWKGWYVNFDQFFWFTYPKYDGYIIAKRSKPLFQTRILFEKKLPLTVYRSLTKKKQKNACKSASDAPLNVVLEGTP